MQKATAGKRIGAFFIDSLISGIVIALISSLLEDPEFLRQLTAIEEAYLNGSMDFLAYSDALDALVDPNLWIKQLVSLVLSIGYFIVLPLFWKEQTIGRKVTKIKVVQENNQPAKLQHFIIREGIGQLLFISVFGFLVTVTNVTIFETIESILNTILVLEDRKCQSDICIRCGKCNEVCPVGIMPASIINDKKHAKELKIDKCIKCGLCSYVCPSKIEVREILESIKGEK